MKFLRLDKRILSIMVIFLLIVSTLSVFWARLFKVSAQGMGSLTGTIYDSGVDTDLDGTFDFLKVGVEVNVSTAGMFQVQVYELLDSAYNYINVWSENSSYLDVGIQVVYLSFNGPAIYASGFNPINVSTINLYDEYYTQLGFLHDVSLSREYSYTEFDLPPATLTGTIYDSGVDTDLDGTFDFLKVGVEVNVSISGTFTVMAQGLIDSAYNFIMVWSENSSYLDVGIQVVYLSLDGPTIYASGFNPIDIHEIYLYDESYNLAGHFMSVPLSREYSFMEFDPPVGSLTGNIYDRGVDTDEDGAFDYLEVGVEVNVSISGTFQVEVSGLYDLADNFIEVGTQNLTYLDVGIQVVYLHFDGPSIYTSGLSPTRFCSIYLYDEYHNVVDVLMFAFLSREYSYTEFDSTFGEPFADIEAVFVVYPDGRVVMEGALISTDMESPNTGPSVCGGCEIKKNDILTMVSANFSFAFPPEEASQFPFNSSVFTLFSEYSSDILTATVSGSTILPPSNASEFPFNITDFTVMGTYMGNIIKGNITVDVWNGFPLDDIIIDFQGNNTYVHLNGSTTVIFGNYPDFGEINATVLEQLLADLTSTIGGQGPNSLYNMTNGLLELTMLNNVTTLHNGDATVDFEAKVEGNLIQTLVNMSGQPTFLYDVLNTTWYSVESGSLLLTYAHAVREADIDLVFTVNMTKLIESMILIIPEIPDMPPEMISFLESILNTTYCAVESAQVSLDYEFGQAALITNATIQDFNAELNYIKSMFLTYNFSQPWTSQLQTLNETQIDLTDFRMSLNLTETALEAEVNGFAVMAPIDWINATSFQLERFFNITASEDEPPGERERLEVTVEGGSNATHTIRIFRPVTVPEPDMSAPGGMTWNNQSVSKLKDLIFQVGPADDVPPIIGTPINTPEIPDDGEDVTVSVDVTDADTGVRPDGVILSYSTDDGETWKNVTMNKTTGNTYEGTIPGLPAGTQVKYMITASDYAGNEAAKNNAGQYYVFTVIPEFPTWQIVVLTLLLIGTVIVIFKRRRKIAGNFLTTNKLVSIFA